MSIEIRLKKIPNVRLNNKRLTALLRSVCRHFRIKNAVIEIEIANNSRIRQINRKYLKKNRTTDCISFDLSEKTGKKLFLIIVNAQIAARQARKRRHRQEAELFLYTLHGLLHNLGFDDSTKQAAALMHKTEDKFLHKIGLGLVYNSG